MKLILILTLLMGLDLSQAWSGEISSIDLRPTSSDSLVEITGDSLHYTKEEKKNPPQLVLTFDNATLAAKVKRTIDAGANANKGVLQVSSYPVDKEKVRVVVDFDKTRAYSVSQADDKVSVRLDSQPKVEKMVATITESSAVPFDAKNSNEVVNTIMSSQNTQKFTGSPISLNLKEADVHEVLRMIGETSGFNMVINPLVQGKITVELDQVPWDQALDVVLTTLKLGAERTNSVLRIMPRDLLLREKQDELDAQKLVASSSPRITRIFPISYADMSSLSGLLQTFANSQSSAPGASGVPATILVDQNTQSLVIRDTAENVDRMRKMIQLLDVQTPQVLIEAKVVEASEDFTKDLEGSVGLTGPGNIYSMGLNQSAGAGTAAAGTAGNSSPTRGNSLTMGFGSAIKLTANLTYAEKLSKARVVSSPKTIVLSGKSSSINQSTSYGYLTTTTVNGIATSSAASAQANTKLDVTPRVTNDGSVFMKLNLSRDVLNLANAAAPTVEPRTMNTEVIVESGNTLVIGGILNLDENSSEEGFPILRKLPIIGWLFGSEINIRSKRELMFFVTPRILNQKKAGMSGTEEGSKT